MNARQLISALVILMFSFSLQAQNETILFGQQKAINNLSKDAAPGEASNNPLPSSPTTVKLLLDDISNWPVTITESAPLTPILIAPVVIADGVTVWIVLKISWM